MARYLYSELASLVQARANCAESGNDEWFSRHAERIETLVSEHMPSGSGFDSGTKIDLDASHADKLVFTTSFHHMHESGMYDGWTEHTVTVTPSLTSGFHLRISGRNRNDIKEYIADCFNVALEHDLKPEMDWQMVSQRVGCEVKSTWVDSCTQRWYVVHDGAVISTDGFTNYLDARAWAVNHFQEIK
jgi:hypothetical protein